MSEPILIVGFGSQAQAWAANLTDSGRDVRVALRRGSDSRAVAGRAGHAVVDLEDALVHEPLVALLTPDETQPAIFADLVDRLVPGTSVVFAHGYNVTHDRLCSAAHVDRVLVAPKGIGPAVRRLFVEGSGVACLIGVDRDVSGEAWGRARRLAADLGGSRAGIYESSFAEETRADLFSEQAVLIGGVPTLVQAAFDLLVARGYAPEVAYFECVHELKLITDMVIERGFAGMFERISNTAKYGGLTVGDVVIDDGVRSKLESILDRIESGAFATEFEAAVAEGLPGVKASISRMRDSTIERTGREVRERMEAQHVVSDSEPAADGS